MGSFLNLTPRTMMGAAIVGIVGAAGVFIYEQIYAEKRRAMLVSEVARLDKQVTTMRSELEALRELQRETANRRLKQRTKPQRPKRERKEKTSPGRGDAPGRADAAGRADGADLSCASDSEYFTDYQSVLGTDADMDSEEFYDVHTDDEDDTLREEIRNGHAVNPLDQDLKLEDISLEDQDKKAPHSPKKNET